MRVLVCGGRDFADFNLFDRVMREVESRGKIDVIIEGGAKGADAMAKEWAYKRAVRVATFPADWNRYGKAAGMIRNQQMLNEGKPDIVVAFPTPTSVGTWGMIKIAQQAYITTHTVLK